MKTGCVIRSPIAGVPDSVWVNHVVPYLSRAQLTVFGFSLDSCRALGISPRPLDPALFTGTNLDRVYRFRSDDIRLSWRPRREPTVLVRILDTEKQIVVIMALGLLRPPEFIMTVMTHMEANPIQARVYPPHVHFMSPEIKEFRDRMVQVVVALGHPRENVVCRQTLLHEQGGPSSFKETYPLRSRESGIVPDVHYAI